MSLYCFQCGEKFDNDEVDINDDCPLCDSIQSIQEYFEMACLDCGEIWEGVESDFCPVCESENTIIVTN